MKKVTKKHLHILLAGFLHALKSTTAVVMFGAAIALFCCVPIERGYLAVGEFVAALLGVFVSVLLFYSCGYDLQSGRFSK